MTINEALALIEWGQLQDSGCGAVDMLLLGSVMLTSDSVLWTIDKNIDSLAARFDVAFGAAKLRYFKPWEPGEKRQRLVSILISEFLPTLPGNFRLAAAGIRVRSGSRRNARAPRLRVSSLVVANPEVISA